MGEHILIPEMKCSWLENFALVWCCFYQFDAYHNMLELEMQGAGLTYRNMFPLPCLIA